MKDIDNNKKRKSLRKGITRLVRPYQIKNSLRVYTNMINVHRLVYLEIILSIIRRKKE